MFRAIGTDRDGDTVTIDTETGLWTFNPNVNFVYWYTEEDYTKKFGPVSLWPNGVTMAKPTKLPEAKLPEAPLFDVDIVNADGMVKGIKNVTKVKCEGGFIVITEANGNVSWLDASFIDSIFQSKLPEAN